MKWIIGPSERCDSGLIILKSDIGKTYLAAICGQYITDYILW